MAPSARNDTVQTILIPKRTTPFVNKLNHFKKRTTPFVNKLNYNKQRTTPSVNKVNHFKKTDDTIR